MKTNNKLRKALMKILNLTNSLDEDCAVDPVEIRDIAKAALAEPIRNCEVGTDNEQIRRWKEFCDHYEVDRSPESFARWAQGPYFEEGGAK